MKNEEIRFCSKCGKKLKKFKSELMARAEISHPEDSYDGAYKPIYFYFCKCWKSDGNKQNICRKTQ